MKLKIISPLKIRGKLYLFILSILVLNLIATYLFGQTMLENFYINNKSRELISFKSQISKSYIAGNEIISQEIGKAEENNINVLIFSISDNAANVEYFSRTTGTGMPGPGGMFRDRQRYNPVTWINFALNNNTIEKLDKMPLNEHIILSHQGFSMHEEGNTANKSMQLYSKIDDAVYLFLETPQELISQTANLAVKFMLYISLITLLVALVVLAFVSKKITTPISEVEKIANKIANLDFSEKCKQEGKDEIGMLSKSINRMSQTLQENISSLTVMNATLREDLDREEKTNKIRREFIANVSHDFKTPLSLITAYSEAIKDDLNDGSQTKDELLKRCEIIISESNKMDMLVNQLLRLSQLENKMVELKQSLFDLVGLINDVIYKNQIILLSKNLKVEFTDKSEKIAFGDYTKMEQVFSNLFENAIKYSKENKEIKIYIEKNTKYRVHIYNEAKNIEGIDTDRLFMSFYKEDQSRSLEEKSYGLGLAIVKAIVDLHGNKCGAYTQGDGIVFWFELEEFNEDI